MFAVWANMHGGFFLGWAPLGAYCAEALFLRWRGRPVPDERRLWMVSAASILASGLNPNGFRAATILSTYQNSALQMSLLEWQHTALWPPEMFGVLLFAGAAALLWARGQARISDWLLFLAFAAAGIDMVRNVILIGLIAPIVIASYIPWKRAVPVLAEFLVAVLVLAGAGAQIARGGAFQFRAAEWRYPGGAADFLLAHNVNGPIFNTYGYGGCGRTSGSSSMVARSTNRCFWITGGWPVMPIPPAARAAMNSSRSTGFKSSSWTASSSARESPTCCRRPFRTPARKNGNWFTRMRRP
jgi:hypothetical protein